MPTFQITGPDGKRYRVTGESPEGAMAALQQMQTSAPETVSPHGPIASAALGAMDAATFGFADEIGSGLDYVADKLPGGRGRPYDEILAANRGELAGAQEANPGSYLTGQIGGGIAQGVGLGGLGLLRGVNAARAGAGLGRTAAASAVDGAALGAAQGAGSGEGVGGRIAGATTGLVGGGILGGAAPYAIAGATAAAKPLVAPIAARLRPDQYANAAISEGMRRGGIMADDVARQLEQAGADGQGMFTVADAMGNSGQRMLSTIARTPNDARQGVVDTLTTRQNGQGERLSNALAEGFGAPDTAAQRTTALTNARTAEANELYGRARASAGPVNVTPILAEIDATLSPGATGLARPNSNIANDTIEAALARVRSMISDGRSNLTDFNALFRTKLDLDDMIARSDGQGAGNRAHALTRVQRLVDDALAGASPEYAGARDAFSAASRRIDAVGEGSAAASGRTRAADNIPRFEGMPADQQQAFRAGYVDPLISRVEAASSSPTTNKARGLLTEKTAQEFPAFAAEGQGDLMGRRIGREQRMFETASAALGGSRTADNLADAAEAARFDPGIVTGFMERGLIGGTMNAVGKALAAGRGMPEPVMNRVAAALMERNPEAARRALMAAQAKGETNDAARGRAIAIMNALNASGSGRLAAP